MKHLTTCCLLLAAIGCYFLGLALPGSLFLLVALGIAFEMGFWLRVSKLFKKKA